MIWAILPFVEAFEQVQNGDGAGAVQPIEEDLKGLLATPPKNDASRQKLATKQITLDGREYRLSDIFAAAAVQVSDELNLDELAAAALVFNAHTTAKDRGIPPADAALALYYQRQQFIVAILDVLARESADEQARHVVKPQQTLVARLLGTEPLAHVLAALKAVEQRLGELDEKTKRGEFMGLAENLGFVQTLALQRDFLVRSHADLSNLATAVVRANLASVEQITAMITHMATFTGWGSLELAYIAPVTLFFSKLDIYLEQTVAGLSPLTDAAPLERLFGVLCGDKANHTWKQKWWWGAIAHNFLAFYAGYVGTNHGDLAPVLAAVRRAIDAGAYELLYAVASDLAGPPGVAELTGNDFGPIVRTKVPAFVAWAPALDPTMLKDVYKTLELVVEAVCTNLADILKEMRLNEEDTYLALTSESVESAKPSATQSRMHLQVLPNGRLKVRQAEPAETSSERRRTQTERAAPGMDLERFFLFVGQLYRGRGEAAAPFWKDRQGALYGFLVWGARCQVAFMAAAFAELLASVGSGSSAADANEFLSAGGAAAVNSAEYMLTWEGVKNYLGVAVSPVAASRETASAGSAPSSHSSHSAPGAGAGAGAHAGAHASAGAGAPATGTGAPATGAGAGAQAAEPSAASATSSASGASGSSGLDPLIQLANEPDTLLVLLSYLRLIHNVVASCPPAAEGDLPRYLFEALRVDTPLVPAALCALGAYGQHRSPHELWTHVDEWAFVAKIHTSGRVLRAGSRFDKLLTTTPAVIGFVALVRALGRQPGPRFAEYVEFVLGDVLVVATEGSLGEEGLVLQREVLGFAREVLASTAGAAAGAAGAGVAAVATAGAAGAAAIAAAVTGTAAAIATCSARIASTPLEAYTELPPSAPLVRAVADAQTVLAQLVASGHDDSVLYHLEVVPHLALAMGSAQYAVALSATRVMALLAEAPAFRATPTRRDRVLSILESVSDGSRIRFGLVDQLERDDESPELDAVKQAILAFLVLSLAAPSAGPAQGSVAHQLLGFKVRATGGLEIDRSPGGIGSGLSLLDSVCRLLAAAIADMSAERVDDGPAQLAALASRVLLLLCREPAACPLLLDHLRESHYLLGLLRLEPVALPSTCFGAAAFAPFFQHRAALLELLAVEVHTAARQQLLSLLSRYLDALMNLQHGASKSALSFLDFMKFPLPPSAAARAAQLACLKAWCQLVPVLVNTGDHLVFVLETIQTLVPKLSEYAREDPAFCRPLASLLVLLLERLHATDVAAVDRMHSLFVAAVQAVPAAASAPELRTDLYAICYQSVRAPSSQLTPKLDVVVTAGDRFIRTVCTDVLAGTGRLQLAALVLLQALAAIARQAGSPVVEQALVRYNLLGLLVQGLAPLDAAVARSRGARADRSVLKVTLALLLQLAQTRAGADQILAAGLFDCLDASILLKPEASGQQPVYDVVQLLLQLLAACVISMGADNSRVRTETTKLLERHQHLVMVVLRQDALSHGLGGLAELASVVVLLLSLTGFVPLSLDRSAV